MIAPTDPRHGSPAGYVAGCRQDCCRRPRMRQQKATRYRVHRGQPTHYSPEAVQQLLGYWHQFGISTTAILTAAGVADGSGRRAFGTYPVLADTYHRIAAVTEDDLPGKATVHSDLTKRRIYSLAAAGHSIRDMPIATTGRWRDYTNVRIEVARDIRAYYNAHQYTTGPNRNGAARARNAGHPVPAAWDDPGTLAWPKTAVVRELPEVGVDEAVVLRLLAGERVPATVAEKDEAMRRWVAAGRTRASLNRAHGWRDARYGRAS